jgi:hypothetical protein
MGAARALSDCSLRSRGSRFEAAAFFSHSQTRSVSARSVVQASGARSASLGTAVFVVAGRGKNARGRAISDARGWVLELLQVDRAQRVVSESGSAG